jgi:2-methylisocitrate lyase-like PEP mutase family enzyme
VEVALEARSDPELMIIARTDARSEHGFGAALERGERYAQAGADVIFIQGLETEAELKEVAARIEVPFLLNVAKVDGLGSLSPDRLRATGCRMAIFPGLGMLAATAAMSIAYDALKRDGSLAQLGTALFDREAMHRLMGFDDIWAFEERWRDDR